MAFGKDDREYAKPVALPDWLKDFADNELKKEGNPFDDIRNLFRQKNDVVAFEEKVKQLREQVGLDKIEKQATIRHVERAKEHGEGTTMKWCVYPKDGGKALGCHDSKEGAEKQLRAIEMSKAGRADDQFFIQEVKDEIFGGFGDSEPSEKFDKEQLEKGIRVELEHTDDPEIAEEITKDHLTESKDFKDGNGAKYYDKLDDMEEEMKNELTDKKSMLANLITTANKLEFRGEFEAVKLVDSIIKKIATELEILEKKLYNHNMEKEANNDVAKKRFKLAKDKNDESILDKHPELTRMIDNICHSRGGFIEVPAIMHMLYNDKLKDEKLTDKDKDEIKDYIKDKIKDTKKNIGEDDDVSGSYVVFVINEDDGNNDVFDMPRSSRM